MPRRRVVAWSSAALVVVALIVLAITRPWTAASDASRAAVGEHEHERSGTSTRTEADERAELEFGGRLTGKVLDTDDVPIAHAQVCTSSDSHAWLSEQGWRPRCVLADERGWFEIDGVEPGRHRLLASARGFIPPPVARGPSGLLVDVVAGQAREHLLLRLRRGGAELRGIVFDIAGGTVADAMVFCEGAMTATDDDGRFSLWLDLRSFVRISVRAEGYADASLLEMRPLGRELEIRLRPEVVLAGRVVRADTGEPVEDVAVIGSGGAPEPQVRTDAEGRFRFTGLAPGRYKPEVRSGSWRGAADTSELLTIGGESPEIEIRVHPARQLGGRVVSDGAACETATIVVYQAVEGGSAVERGSADSSGAFLVGGLRPGPYTVEATCESSRVQAFVDLSEEDVLDAVWEIEMPSGRSIHGRVVDGSGRGVAMAYVQAELYEPEDPGTAADGRAVTASDGSFEMLDMPPGIYRFDRVQAEGFGEPSEQPKLTLPRDRDVDGFEIVLPDPGALRVRVRDANGEPVPNVEIKLGQGLGGSIWKSTPSSEWLIDPLTPGSYHVQVLRAGVGGRAGPDDPSAGQLGEPVEVVAGHTAELTLTAAARNQRVAGLVRSTDGEPIADAAVWALGGETYVSWGGVEKHPEVARTVTDLDGRFVLEQLEVGSYAVHVRSLAGVEQVREPVESGTLQLVFELPRGGSVAGRVAVAGGDPPASFSISFKPIDGRGGCSENFLFSDGAWRIVGLPPGEAVVEVSASEGTASAHVMIPEGGEPPSLELELAARGSVRGRVVNRATGEPVPGFLVTAPGSAAALDVDSKRYTGADGSFELSHVASGEVELRLWSARARRLGYRDFNVRVKVEPGGMTELGTIDATREPVAAP